MKDIVLQVRKRYVTLRLVPVLVLSRFHRLDSAVFVRQLVPAICWGSKYTSLSINLLALSCSVVKSAAAGMSACACCRTESGYVRKKNKKKDNGLSSLCIVKVR